MTNKTISKDAMTAILHQAKSSYTITDKTTGEVLGHAFMQVEGQVTTDQLQLLPCQVVDVEDDHLPTRNASDSEKTKFPGTLESDLDLSEDSSMNATVEDEIYSQPCAMINKPDMLSTLHNSETDFENNVVQSRLVPSNEVSFASETSVPQTASNSFQQVASSPVPAKLVIQSFAAQIASKMSSQKKKPNVKESRDDEQEDMDLHVTRKRKTDSDEQPPSKKVNLGSGFPFPKYQALYTDEGVEQPENVVSKNRRVRCLLCTDGRTLVVGNFGGHVKALHLPDVKCEDCGQDVKASRVNHHKKNCMGKNKSRLVENKTENHVLSQRSQPEPAPGPSHTSFNISSSSEVKVSETSFVSCASSLVEGPENIKNSVLPKDSAGGSVHNNNPVLSRDKGTNVSEDMITFVLTSAAKESVRVKIMTVKGNKMKKVMKKFGQKLCVDIAGLQFMLGCVKLSGEEVAGKLEGRDIIVWGDL